MAMAELLAGTVAAGASDLHLSSGLAPRVRVDGELVVLPGPPLPAAAVEALLLPLLGPDQQAALRQREEVDFAVALPGLPRFRANAFHHHHGLGAVFRVIPAQVPSLEALGCPPVLRQVAASTHGLVLVTGPTGSGKSTTLAALIDHLNHTRRGHILTLEDPVEFVHAPAGCLVTQRQVHRDTPSFESALRAALREDPDVLLVGELRDAQTIRLALTAAETGHLVLGTLHTGSAARAVDRIIDVFPAGEKPVVRSMLSESLRAVVAQLLLPRRGGGRVAAHEVMVVTAAIRHLIREDRVAQVYSAIQTGQAHGMQTLDQALLALVRGGAVEPGLARNLARDPSLFG